MLRLVIIILALSAIGSAVNAQGFSAETGIAHCAKIGNTKNRLACYDKLANELQQNSVRWDQDANAASPAAPAARVIQGFQPTGYGEWVLREANASDGSKDVALAIFTTGRAGGASGGTLRVTLWLRCSDNKTLLYVDWNATVDTGGRSVVRMQTQIDSEPAQETHWARYSNHNITGMYTDRASVDLIKRLFGRSMLEAKLNEKSAAYSASFNVTGLEQAITPLRTACEW